MDLFLVFLIFTSSKIVCPRDTDFLSGQTVNVHINGSSWHYFIINLLKHESSVQINIKTNTTAWLYKGSGMYCPNHAWIFYFKRLRSWWSTTFTVRPSSFDFFSSSDLARIQTFGIYAQNSTFATIQVSEESPESLGVTPFCVLTSILIFFTILLMGRYLLIKKN